MRPVSADAAWRGAALPSQPVTRFTTAPAASFTASAPAPMADEACSTTADATCWTRASGPELREAPPPARLALLFRAPPAELRLAAPRLDDPRFAELRLAELRLAELRFADPRLAPLFLAALLRAPPFFAALLRAPPRFAVLFRAPPFLAAERPLLDAERFRALEAPRLALPRLDAPLRERLLVLLRDDLALLAIPGPSSEDV